VKNIYVDVEENTNVVRVYGNIKKIVQPIKPQRKPQTKNQSLTLKYLPI
jgi:hypothetical protein